MKKMIACVTILVLFICTPCLAGPFDLQDQEAKEVALFVKKMLGDEFLREVYELYPKATFNWAGRAMGIEPAAITWVVYCEVIQKNEEPLYYYWEIKISDINLSPELVEKYGILLE